MSRNCSYAATLFLTLSLCSLSARTSKGEKFWKDAQAAEEQQNYDRAAELYTLAAQHDPSNLAYEMGERRSRFEAAQAHMKAGTLDRDAGKFEAALQEFQRAFSLDPSNMLAVEELQRTREMLARNKARHLPPEEQVLSPVQIQRKKEDRKVASMLPAPELKPLLNRITTLKMNNQPVKVLYETIGKLAGVNVMFDPTFQPARNANIDINDSTLQEAFDYVALITKTYWKPVTANAIFVTEESVTKRRDYEDQVLKVFYLRNMTTVQEFQEIVTAVRSATDIRRMFADSSQYAVIARGSPDQIALAAKLFHDLDRQKAEVLVDIIVMEVNSSRTRTLASGLATSSGAGGLQLPVSFTPRSSISTTPSTSSGSSSTASTISLSQIGKTGFSDFSISLPGALLEAIMADNKTHILQSPQVRASDGQKVVLKIGDKVPYATGSYQASAVATASLSPLVSTQFNFADVGVNIELTPHVHSDGEVSMHVSVEISSVSRYVDIGGVSQPVISQRKDDADVRMRSGEINLLGGLTQVQSTKSFSGIPGLVSIPILGKLAGSNTATDKEHGELMIALIPHVLRTSDLTESELQEVAAGTEQTVKVSFAHEDVPPPAATAPRSLEAGAGQISFQPPAVDAHPGDKFDVILRSTMDASPEMLQVSWNPALLRLDKIAAAGDPVAVKLDFEIRNDTGEALISRRPGSAVAPKMEDLATLSFVAIGKGACKIATSRPESSLTVTIH